MADTFYVLQLKVAGQTAPSDEFAAADLAESLKSVIRRRYVGSPVVTVIDAFTDTAETTISES